MTQELSYPPYGFLAPQSVAAYRRAERNHIMTAAKPRQMRLGLSMRNPYHVAAWRHPSTPPGAEMRLDYYRRVTQAAERGKFDMAFLADGNAVRARDRPEGSMHRTAHDIVNFEPLTLLSVLSTMTSRIGLIATASTSYNEPYHVARKFASLDHLSGGRAGWNVVTSWTDAEAQNFNREKHFDYATRYERAAEFVKVVKGLWDSWEDDAFPFDQKGGIFFAPEKMHELNHKGKYFSVRGPLNIPRCPQGRPLIVQAGASEVGQDIAAADADVIYAASQDLSEAQAYYASVKGRMAKYGRAPEELKIMPGLAVIVGRTEAEAQRKLDELQELLDPKVGLMMLYSTFGDLSGVDLDGPVPPPNGEGVRSRGNVMYAKAQRENLTLRQLYEAVAVSRGHGFVMGTPAQVADRMEDWFFKAGCDGYNILPPGLPWGIEDFVALVVPELQRRGLFREEYEFATARENLGLEIPLNRYVNGMNLQATA
jgi:alkanesulfonate monooxygenase